MLYFTQLNRNSLLRFWRLPFLVTRARSVFLDPSLNRPTMAEDNKVPSCCSMGTDFKAKEYDKSKFEGTWVFNNGPCCGSMTVTKHSTACVTHACASTYAVSPSSSTRRGPAATTAG